MSFATVYSRALIGIEAPLVKIEVHLSNGLPSFQIVGLPDASIRESRDRVRSAIINSHFQFPQTRLTINLSPADIPKEGARFDLAIAIGILIATKQITNAEIDNYEFFGELSLNGQLRAISGEISTAMACNQQQRIGIFPVDNAHYASLTDANQLLTAHSLIEVFHHLTGQKSLDFTVEHSGCDPLETQIETLDLNDVIGQQQAKRALEIAAAGQHNLMFIGPPGTGKSMLASRLISILPAMSNDEALETASIHAISKKDLDIKTWKTRPFRSPHHTASGVALVGGGSIPKPGEISLAHNGVLFLDELPEFSRQVLDVLREPLETGTITISRAARQADFPARFQLITALNPSPSGSLHDGRNTNDQILRYLSKISGPLLDRIDIQVEVAALPLGSLSSKPEHSESSESIKNRVVEARQLMLNRCNKPNALMSSREVEQHCNISEKDMLFLEQTIHKFNMSIRVFHKIIKVARTIADLQQQPQISREHLMEALSYRAMDRLLNYLTK